MSQERLWLEIPNHRLLLEFNFTLVDPKKILTLKPELGIMASNKN